MTEEITSIDELLERYAVSENEHLFRQELSLEDEFFIHASNIEGWYLHGYDMKAIDTKIGIPILARLWKHDRDAAFAFFSHVDYIWKEGTKNNKLAMAQGLGEDSLVYCLENDIIDLNELVHLDLIRDEIFFIRDEIFFILFKHGFIKKEAYTSRLNYLNKIRFEFFYGKGLILSKSQAFERWKGSYLYYNKKYFPNVNERNMSKYIRDYYRPESREVRSRLEFKIHTRNGRVRYSSVISDPFDYPAFLYSTGMMSRIIEYKSKRYISIFGYKTSNIQRVSAITSDVTHVYLYNVWKLGWADAITRYDDGKFVKEQVYINLPAYKIMKYLQSCISREMEVIQD